MSKKKNDLFDSIDDLFNTLNSEETAKAITDTVSNVGSEIKHSINESLKKTVMIILVNILMPISAVLRKAAVPRLAAHIKHAAISTAGMNISWMR